MDPNPNPNPNPDPNRNLQVDIDEIATGETWLGPDALSRNMVDELATLTLTLT